MLTAHEQKQLRRQAGAARDLLEALRYRHDRGMAAELKQILPRLEPLVEHVEFLASILAPEEKDV